MAQSVYDGVADAVAFRNQGWQRSLVGSELMWINELSDYSKQCVWQPCDDEHTNTDQRYFRYQKLFTLPVALKTFKKHDKIIEPCHLFKGRSLFLGEDKLKQKELYFHKSDYQRRG